MARPDEVVALLAASLAAFAGLSGCLHDDDGSGGGGDRVPAPPADATFETLTLDTELGRMVLVLYPQAAPKTVELLKALVAAGYYDGREFVRAVPGHVIQVVDRADGATDDPRRVPLEVDASYHFSAGAAGIARGSDPGSGGPEIFIMDFATSHLDGNYTVWGQIVEGLDVVHRAARVPAVRTAPLAALGVPVTDQTAVDPATIRRATLGTLTLPGEDAARFPLRVAANNRTGDWRHSMDWPADLAPGRTSELRWFVRPYDPNLTAPDARDVQILIGNQSLVLAGDPDAPGAYPFRWTPSSAGLHVAQIWADGRLWATLRIEVPA